MPESLLDTDIFSEILKGRDQTVAQHATEYRQTYGRITISVITVMEIVKGLHKVGREERIRQFLQALNHVQIVVVDNSSAAWAGPMYADLERTGQPIGRADPIIAAIALQHRLTLVTGNMAHYERIKMLGYPLEIAN